MKGDAPSRTAWGAALHRAAHQLVDRPPVFADPLALTIVGEEAAAELRLRRDRHALRGAAPLRAFIAARSRFAEDELAVAFAGGIRQYVLLGAGLDTFAYGRSGAFPALGVFEVDHPATQGWKRSRLREAGIEIPACVTYVPVDFERETLREGLARAGFDFASPAFFAWLGVTPYLTRSAVMATLAFIASLKSGSAVAFDYAERPRWGSRGWWLAARVAAAGEPFKSFFKPAELEQAMQGQGFSQARDWDTGALNARYFAGRGDGLRLAGRGHLMHARV
jgi:methyltransferase (TIGR00027 family)